MPKSSVVDALKWFKFSDETFAKQRQREKDDLRCQTPDGLWPDEIKGARGAQSIPTSTGMVQVPGRPMLSIPTMDEPIQLILNQQRGAHLGVTIHPLSEDAQDDTAQVLQGLYRRCEQDSRANIVRSWAYDRSTKCGMGWYRIDKQFDPDGGHPLDQKLVLKRILYQGSVYADPFAQEPDFSDATRMMVVSDVPWETYKRKWDKSELSAYGSDDFRDLGDDLAKWVSGDSDESRTIRVAEDWRVEIEQVKWVLLEDGNMAAEGKIPAGAKEVTGDGARWKYEETRKVFWRIINCKEELEPEQEWDGQYIPLIPTIGQEIQPFDGERMWYGMYAKAKDGARLTNYAASAAVEMASLEPKAPWLGEEGVFEGHEREFVESNIRNFPYLQYKRTNLSGAPAEAPQRVQVDTSRMGPSMELLRMGRDFVQVATSTFDPALGKQPTAHRSGRALIALQDQTVESTSHYLDNLANVSMMYESRVWLDLAPKIYDRPGRVARILDQMNVSSLVMINKPFTVGANKRPVALPMDTPEQQQQAQQQVEDPQNPAKHYDLTKGRYGVSVTIGKSSSSRLQQGADALGELLQADPNLVPILGPEYLHYLDFPGHDVASDILKKVRNHNMPYLAPPDPNQNAVADLAVAKQQLDQQHQVMQQMKQALDTDAVKQNAQIEMKRMENDTQIKLQEMKNAAQIEVARISAAKEAINAAAAAEEEAIALGREHAHEIATTQMAQQHERDIAQQQHDQAIEQGQLDHQSALVQGEQNQSHALETQAAQPPELAEGE